MRDAISMGCDSILVGKIISLYVQGNVALDVARILLRPVTELATTDIATHALHVLEESSIRFLAVPYFSNQINLSISSHVLISIMNEHYTEECI